jgi:hypothetical protein
MSQWPDGLVAVDQPAPDGPIEAMVFFHEQRDAARARVIVEDCYVASPEARLRVLHFLGSLKDQYTDAQLTLPADYPLHRVLRESQVPHRQVDHPVAAARPYTRMQVRILDHRPSRCSTPSPMGRRRSARNTSDAPPARVDALCHVAQPVNARLRRDAHTPSIDDLTVGNRLSKRKLCHVAQSRGMSASPYVRETSGASPFRPNRTER